MCQFFISSGPGNVFWSCIKSIGTTSKRWRDDRTIKIDVTHLNVVFARCRSKMLKKSKTRGNFQFFPFSSLTRITGLRSVFDLKKLCLKKNETNPLLKSIEISLTKQIRVALRFVDKFAFRKGREVHRYPWKSEERYAFVDVNNGEKKHRENSFDGFTCWWKSRRIVKLSVPYLDEPKSFVVELLRVEDLWKPNSMVNDLF